MTKSVQEFQELTPGSNTLQQRKCIVQRTSSVSAHTQFFFSELQAPVGACLGQYGTICPMHMLFMLNNKLHIRLWVLLLVRISTKNDSNPPLECMTKHTRQHSIRPLPHFTSATAVRDSLSGINKGINFRLCSTG